MAGRDDRVQWSAGFRPGDGFVWLGVNVEGMRYDDWPVSRLIEREICRPLLLTMTSNTIAIAY